MDRTLALPAGAIDFYEWEDSLKISFSALKTYDFDPDDTGFLPYSSGTTGFPKGVMLSHRNVISNSEMVEINVRPTTLPTTAEYQDVFLALLPLFHIYAWVSIFISKLRLGGKIVTLPSFKPETFLDAIHDHKVTVLNLVPPLMLFLGKSDMATPKHLKSARLVVCGAAPLGASDVEPVLKKAPQVEFGQGYGMTETSCAVLLPILGMLEFGSPGYPVVATECKISALDDPEFKALGPNQKGELLFRGPSIMKGYLNNPEATNETIVANRWMRTGDVGYFNEKGQFFITDRIKELIKVKGLQVAPAELEEVIRSYPDIDEAAVIGVPDERSGELPRAYVIVKEGKKIDEKELLNFVASKVAHYKVPDSIVVTDSIPKNASGKILRRQLKIKYGFLKE